MREELRAEIASAPGLGECLDLLDASEVDRVCGLIASDLEGMRYGVPQSLARGLRELLIYPLERFVFSLNAPARSVRLSNGGKAQLSAGQRMELEPAVALLGEARRVLSVLEAGPQRAPDQATALRLVADLRLAWYVWFGYVATYWLQFEAPEKLTQQRLRKEQGKAGGQAKKKGTQRSADTAAEILVAYREAARTHDPKDVAGIVARKVGCSARWVREVWKRHGPHGTATEEKKEA